MSKGGMSPEAGITFTEEDREVLRAAGYTDEQMDETEVKSRGIPWDDLIDETGTPHLQDQIEQQIRRGSS